MATLVNVCGTARSGSTMLDLMLGNSPDAFSCGEVNAWFRPYRTHHFDIDCACGEKPCPIWETLKDVPEKQFHATVIEALQVNFVIDSSKEICWVIDSQEWAAAHGLTVFNLVLWKEPIDLAYSHWKRGRGLMSWRQEFVGYYSKIFQLRLPFWAIKYEELVADPPAKLRQICAALNMPYFEGKEAFWNKQYHHLFGSLGIRRQVEAGHSKFRAKQALPVEFETQSAPLKEQISADAEVQRILTTLNREDISTLKASGNAYQAYRPQKPYPLWYYFKRIRGVFRRYVPYQFDLTKHETVETVPLGHEKE